MPNPLQLNLKTRERFFFILFYSSCELNFTPRRAHLLKSSFSGDFYALFELNQEVLWLEDDGNVYLVICWRRKTCFVENTIE